MTQLTDADYEIDMEMLMGSLGIDPGTVAADSAKLQFINGKAVLTYTAMRAIPPRSLGVAMLRSAKVPEQTDEPIQEAQPEPDAPTPIRAPRKRTAKKAVAKK